MNAFIASTDEEHVAELATYIAGLPNGGGDKLVEQVKALVAKKQLAQALGQLIANVPSVVAAESVSEGDLASTVNSLTRLLHVFKPEDAAAMARQLAAALASETPDRHDIARLRALVNLFNNLERKSAARHAVFAHIVAYAGHIKQLDAIHSQLDNLDNWLREWGSSIGDKRALYKQLASICKANGKTEAAYRFLVKLLKTYDGADAAALEQAKADARTLVATALTMPAKYDMFQVTQLDAVKTLSGEPLGSVLNAFVAGDLAAYKAVAASSAKALEEQGLSMEAVLQRVRVMSLATLCAEKDELTYGEIASKLGVEEDSVEEWVIDVIHTGLIEAKVDAIERRVNVTRASQSSFNPELWADLRDRLREWKDNIGGVQKVLGDVKQQVQLKANSSRGGRAGR